MSVLAEDADESLASGEDTSVDQARTESTESVVAAAESETIEPSEPESGMTGRWSKWEQWLDVAIVGILAVASLAAAWSVYQSALWDGQQSAEYTQASAKRIESSKEFSYAHQLTIVDVTTFTNFVNAYAVGNTELADFYQARFRADFKPAFNAWLATEPLTNKDAPSSPFVMPEYSLPQLEDADKLDIEATATFEEGQKDNDTSDKYVLNTVFLATALFFCGVAPRVRWFPAQFGLVSLAAVILAFGLYKVATYPIA